MKFSVLLMCFVFFTGYAGFTQNPPNHITLLVSAEIQWQDVATTPGHLPFVAIQDKTNAPAGQIRFAPGGSHWTFSWKYNNVNQLVSYDVDSTILTVNMQGSGSYSFEAQKDGRTEASGEFRVFFAHVPEFSVNIPADDKDNCDEIKVFLVGYTPPVSETYPGNKMPRYTILKGSEERQLAPGSDPAFGISEVPTSKDVDYRIQVTDGFGLEWTSKEAKYTSVIPEAKFSVDPGKGEAPLEVRFANECVNAQKYDWYLYRDSSEMPERLVTVEDSLLDGMIRTENSFKYTYLHPGSYNVKLIAYNTIGTNHCSDTMSIEEYIAVDSSLVDVPNVFTPNGDGVNDIFRAKTVSLQSFQGVIINRWGRKVYEWNNPEGGWDGRINGKYANPGTYYYIITARGWEIDAKKYVKKGPLLLVR